ncbi:hypothetical protein D3C76_248790 [compost metagenome]
MYPLYEFPQNLTHLTQLLHLIEKVQPINKLEAISLVEKLYGKRSSRSEITIRNLRDLGILSGYKNIMLSSETQLYLDMNKSLNHLLLFFVYRKVELFQLCSDLHAIRNFMELDNPELLEKLYSMGYSRDKLSTGREKIYAIKRLVHCCSENNFQDVNPFESYRHYRNFVKVLQECYFDLSLGNFGEAVPITLLRDHMVSKKSSSNAQFHQYLQLLYSDILLSRNVSFTTANIEFAGLGYYEINGTNYYFIKVLSYITERDTLF